MKVTFAIPCDYAHFKFLPRLVENIKSFTEPPDEIVMSVSNIRSKELESQACHYMDSLGIKYVTSLSKQNAAQNRNLCAKLSSCDLVIFQDADDLSAIQRVEITKHIFLSRSVYHLTVGFTHKEEELESGYPYDKMIMLDTIHHKIFADGLNSGLKRRDFYEFRDVNKHYQYTPIANGPCAVFRSVFEEIKYKEERNNCIISEDQDFNFEVFYKYNKSSVLPAALYLYNLSDRMGGGMK